MNISANTFFCINTPDFVEIWCIDVYFHFPKRFPGSGVVFDCIDSWSCLLIYFDIILSLNSVFMIYQFCIHVENTHLFGFLLKVQVKSISDISRDLQEREEKRKEESNNLKSPNRHLNFASSEAKFILPTIQTANKQNMTELFLIKMLKRVLHTTTIKWISLWK